MSLPIAAPRSESADAASGVRRACGQVRTQRNALRELEHKCSRRLNWNDNTEEAKRRIIREGQQAIIDATRPEVDRAHQLAAGFTDEAAAERLSTARYFRDARFNDVDRREDLLQRILLELQLPRMKEVTLAAMAYDCVARGGDDNAALLHAIRRELDYRPNAGRALKVAVIDAESKFPLPEALTKERKLVAAIARDADAITSAWNEMTAPALHRDNTDRVEFYRDGGTPPELPAAVKQEEAAAEERKLPFKVPGIPQTDHPTGAA
jgi:hypothetical protein